MPNIPTPTEYFNKKKSIPTPQEYFQNVKKKDEPFQFGVLPSQGTGGTSTPPTVDPFKIPINVAIINDKKKLIESDNINNKAILDTEEFFKDQPTPRKLALTFDVRAADAQSRFDAQSKALSQSINTDFEKQGTALQNEFNKKTQDLLAIYQKKVNEGANADAMNAEYARKVAELQDDYNSRAESIKTQYNTRIKETNNELSSSYQGELKTIANELGMDMVDGQLKFDPYLEEKYNKWYDSFLSKRIEEEYPDAPYAKNIINMAGVGAREVVTSFPVAMMGALEAVGNIIGKPINAFQARDWQDLSNQLKTLDALAVQEFDKYDGDIAGLAQQGDIAGAAAKAGLHTARAIPLMLLLAQGGTLGAMVSRGTAVGVTEAQMAAAGKSIQRAAMGYMGAGKGAQQFVSNINDPDINLFSNAVSSVGVGLSEVFFEDVGTMSIINRLSKVAQEAGEQQLRGQMNSLFKNRLSNTLSILTQSAGPGLQEAASEMATQLTDNIINKYMGISPNIKLGDGVVDSGIVGWVMGQGMALSMTVPQEMGGPKAVLRNAIKKLPNYYSFKAKTELAPLVAQRDIIEAQMKNVTPAIKAQYNKIIQAYDEKILPIAAKQEGWKLKKSPTTGKVEIDDIAINAPAPIKAPLMEVAPVDEKVYTIEDLPTLEEIDNTETEYAKQIDEYDEKLAAQVTGRNDLTDDEVAETIVGLINRGEYQSPDDLIAKRDEPLNRAMGIMVNEVKKTMGSVPADVVLDALGFGTITGSGFHVNTLAAITGENLNKLGERITSGDESLINNLTAKVGQAMAESEGLDFNSIMSEESDFSETQKQAFMDKARGKAVEVLNTVLDVTKKIGANQQAEPATPAIIEKTDVAPTKEEQSKAADEYYQQAMAKKDPVAVGFLPSYNGKKFSFATIDKRGNISNVYVTDNTKPVSHINYMTPDDIKAYEDGELTIGYWSQNKDGFMEGPQKGVSFGDAVMNRAAKLVTRAMPKITEQSKAEQPVTVDEAQPVQQTETFIETKQSQETEQPAPFKVGDEVRDAKRNREGKIVDINKDGEIRVKFGDGKFSWFNNKATEINPFEIGDLTRVGETKAPAKPRVETPKKVEQPKKQDITKAPEGQALTEYFNKKKETTKPQPKPEVKKAEPKKAEPKPQAKKVEAKATPVKKTAQPKPEAKKITPKPVQKAAPKKEAVTKQEFKSKFVLTAEGAMPVKKTAQPKQAQKATPKPTAQPKQAAPKLQPMAIREKELKKGWVMVTSGIQLPVHGEEPTVVKDVTNDSVGIVVAVRNNGKSVGVDFDGTVTWYEMNPKKEGVPPISNLAKEGLININENDTQNQVRVSGEERVGEKPKQAKPKQKTSAEKTQAGRVFQKPKKEIVLTETTIELRGAKHPAIIANIGGKQYTAINSRGMWYLRSSDAHNITDGKKLGKDVNAARQALLKEAAGVQVKREKASKVRNEFDLNQAPIKNPDQAWKIPPGMSGEEFKVWKQAQAAKMADAVVESMGKTKPVKPATGKMSPNDKIAKGFEDLAVLLGTVKKIEGEEMPDPIKAVHMIAEGLMEKGVASLKDLKDKIVNILRNMFGATKKDAIELVNNAKLDEAFSPYFEAQKKPQGTIRQMINKAAGVTKEVSVVTTKEYDLLKERMKTLSRGSRIGFQEALDLKDKAITSLYNMIKASKPQGFYLREMLTAVNALKLARTQAGLENAVSRIDEAFKKMARKDDINDAINKVKKIKKDIKDGKFSTQQNIVSEFATINPRYVDSESWAEYKRYVDMLVSPGEKYANIKDLAKFTFDLKVKTDLAIDEMMMARGKRKEIYEKIGELKNGKLTNEEIKAAISQQFDITEAFADILIDRYNKKSNKENEALLKQQEEDMDMEDEGLVDIRAELIDDATARLRNTKLDKDVYDNLSEEEQLIVDEFFKLKKSDIEALDDKALLAFGTVMDKLEQGWISNNMWRTYVLPSLRERIKQAIKEPIKISAAEQDAINQTMKGIFSSAKRKKFSRQQIISELEADMLYKIDDHIGKLKHLPIYKTTLAPLVSATVKARMAEDVIQKGLKLLETVNRPAFDSSVLMKMYLLQKEHLANGKDGDVVGEYINKIIEESSIYDPIAKDRIQELYDSIPKDPDKNIDMNSLWDMFEDGEKAFLNYHDEVGFNDLLPKLQAAESLYRGNYFEPINSHTRIIVDIEGQEQYESDPIKGLLGRASLDETKAISTRAKSAITRQPGIRPIRLDAVGDFNRQVRETYFDYHMTPQLQIVLGGLKEMSRETKASTEKEFIEGIYASYNQALKSEFNARNQEYGDIGKIVAVMLRSSYESVLASVRRIPAESLSNLVMAVITHPEYLNAGKGRESFRDVMEFTGDPQKDRMGRDTKELLEMEVKDESKDRLTLTHGFWHKPEKFMRTNPLRKLKERVSTEIITMSDKFIGESYWKGAFLLEFQKLSGEQFDHDAFTNDPNYRKRFLNEITMSSREAAFQTSLLINTGSPLETMQSLRGVDMLNVWQQINNFVRSFSANETSTAWTAVKSLVGNGILTKQGAARILTGIVLRQYAYNLMMMASYNVVSALVAGIFSPEDRKKQLKEISQMFTPENLARDFIGAAASLAIGKWGNAWKLAIAFSVEEANKKFTKNALNRPYDSFKDGILYLPIKDITTTKELVKGLGAFAQPSRLLLDMGEAISRGGNEAEWTDMADMMMTGADLIFGLPFYKDMDQVVRAIDYARNPYVRSNNAVLRGIEAGSFKVVEQAVRDIPDYNYKNAKSRLYKQYYYGSKKKDNPDIYKKLDVSVLLDTELKTEDKVEYLFRFHKQGGYEDVFKQLRRPLSSPDPEGAGYQGAITDAIWEALQQKIKEEELGGR